MKRRSFLRLLGAAVAAPALPAVAPRAAAAATYNRYTYGMAVFHARTRAHVSARGLAHCLRISLPQAEAMIAEMATQGLVRPVTGTGSVRAVSNILKPDAWGLDAAARRARTAERQARRLLQRPADTPHWAEPDLSLLLAHLRRIARTAGLPPALA